MKYLYTITKSYTNSKDSIFNLYNFNEVKSYFSAISGFLYLKNIPSAIGNTKLNRNHHNIELIISKNPVQSDEYDDKHSMVYIINIMDMMT